MMSKIHFETDLLEDHLQELNEALDMEGLDQEDISGILVEIMIVEDELERRRDEQDQ